MDRTLKMRAYTPGASETSNLTREQELELELAKKAAQLEEEKRKSLETLKVLEHMREVHKNEQARSAELQARLNAAEDRIKELRQTLDKIAALAGEKAPG